MMRIALGVILLTAVCESALGEDPIDIGSQRELFVDDYLIDKLTGG